GRVGEPDGAEIEARAGGRQGSGLCHGDPLLDQLRAGGNCPRGCLSAPNRPTMAPPPRPSACGQEPGGAMMSERRRIPPLSPFEEEVGFTRALRVGDRILVAGTTANRPDGTVPVDAGE